MAATDAIQRKVPAQAIIKPWLILGPFYRDLAKEVVGPTFFEDLDNTGTENGRDVLQKYVEKAEPILTAQPVEENEQTYLDKAETWELVRRPEKMLMWGEHYFLSNHLWAVFLTTLVQPEKQGKTRFRLVLPISSRAQVYLNGTAIFDTEGARSTQRQYMFEYRFEADLEAGENVLSVGLYRIGRMARVGFRLECDQPLKARIPLAKGMSRTRRLKVERDIEALRMERDIFYDSHSVGVRVDRPIVSDAHLICRLIRDGKTLKTLRRRPKRAGLLRMCKGADLPTDKYSLLCEFADESGRKITAARFALGVITPTPPMTGYRRLEQRRKATLKHFAERRYVEEKLDIWGQVARYALEHYEEIDDEAIRRTCKLVADRLDCADFVIQGLIRLAYWDRRQKRLSPKIRATIKKTLLGFKYWADEPVDTAMYISSENHRILCHVAEYLAGQLYPTTEFTNSRQRGLFHVTKARVFIMEWLRQRGRFGFDEWHSNSYYPVNICPLLNLYDFAVAEDCKLKLLTRNVLHYMFFNLAADTFGGVFGTTHGRSYGVNLKYPDVEETAATCWLLFGQGSLHGGMGMAAVCLTKSDYELPELIYKIAADYKTVSLSRQQQGTLPEHEPSANFVVYRTPDYMMSALQDYRKGELEPATHVGQITFTDKTVVFFSCPYTCGEGNGLRPDYWSGNATLPRVIQHHNVMSLTWRLNEMAWMTHCFFEQERFDKVAFEGKWVFARKGAGYIGIWAQNGMEVGNYGQYAGRELICYAPENTWLIECGREADWGSFKAFVQAVKSASIAAKGGEVIYDSPSIGRFVTGWDAQPTVADEPVQTRDYPLLESPFGESRYGSGEMTLRYGADKLRLYFNF